MPRRAYHPRISRTHLGCISQVVQLREARELAVADAERWNTRYNELKRQFDEQALASSHQQTASEVRALLACPLPSVRGDRLPYLAGAAGDGEIGAQAQGVRIGAPLPAVRAGNHDYDPHYDPEHNDYDPHYDPDHNLK